MAESIKLYQENVTITKDTDDAYIKAKIKQYPKLEGKLKAFLTKKSS